MNKNDYWWNRPYSFSDHSFDYHFLMNTKEMGLMEKFEVHRVDGKDQPGGSKENAKYFVLDYVNDDYAKQALMFYAFICQREYPKLSSDLWLALRGRGKNE